ncbi:MAG: M48 family metallopeptidase [Candidatus Nanoarchaeia archaeon]|nr:M48 family metallopeptidase [Candidatus Nanoarchaeia archaeon]MDD5357889.1 M48 family metallopeptidase [Candidatus Nanoarchaeia archaeon]MDD5588808.1 M48 family metallopeptidase [Candidatus Nanoarchaeia archaeon]
MVEEIRINFRDQISRNKWKSFFLMFIVFAVLVALVYVIGFLVWGAIDIFSISIIAIVISISYLLFSYYNSDKIALLSVGAKEAGRESHIFRQYHDLVEGLTLASGIKKPKLYFMKSEQINAFASGRNQEHAVICVTEGALRKLDKRELEGVLAHELGHIGNCDIRYMTLVAVMVGMISIISEIFLRSLYFKGNNNDDSKGNAFFMAIGIILAIIAPILVYLVQLAISRKREFSADATAVQFTRYPPGLIGALKKIKEENHPEKKITKAIAPLFFANPFRDLGSTHPAIQKRISVLERM